MKKTFFKQFKKDLKNKKEHKKAFLFLFLFLSFFIFFYIFFGLILSKYIIYFFGYFSSLILTSVFKVANVFSFDAVNNLAIISISKLKEPIIISFLCSGIIEFCLLASAIFASKGTLIKKRFYGFFLSLPLIIFFNFFRIIFTVFIILNFRLGLAEFLHGFLFKLFLIIIVIGFYYFWFRYSYK